MNNGAGSEFGGLKPGAGHDVEDGFAPSDEIIGHDPPVASPPDRLGTHDGATLLASDRDEMFQAGVEGFRQCVVGVVVEAFVGPEGVGVWGDFLAFSTQTAEGGDVLVGDFIGSERVGKRVLIELRIGARSWNRADINEFLDTRSAEEFGEFLDASVRVADGEERESHAGAFTGFFPKRCPCGRRHGRFYRF